MKKALAFITILACLYLAGCNNDVKENSQSTSEPLTQTSMDEAEPVTTSDNPQTESTTENAIVQNSLPQNVVLSISGNALTDEKPTEVNYGENNIWMTARYEGFAYIAEPSASEFKRYGTGEEICGLKLVSADNTFSNEYMDNEYHDTNRCSSYVRLEGTLTVTGLLKVESEDGSNLMYQKGDIIFIPDSNPFPVISGLYNNEYERISCGNVNDNVISELSGLAAGDEIRAEISVSNIELVSAYPVETYVNCKIDSVRFQQ